MSLGGQDGGLSLPSTAPIPLSSLSTSSIESVPPSIVSTTHATEPLVSRIPQHNNSLLSDFEQRCATSSLPPPGPEHFEARRNLWLGRPPSGDTTSTLRPQKSPPVSNARSRLEELLSRPGALESDEVWNAGLVRVWKGLVGGGRLKKALPLNLVIKILYAGWWRDDTWPKGAAPPENDPFFDSPLLVSLSDVPAPTMFPGVSETTSGAPSDTTSWLLDID